MFIYFFIDRNCGCFVVGKLDFYFIKGMIVLLLWYCIKYDILIFGDLRDRYLMLFLLLDYVGVFDYSGGVLRVDKVFRVF